MQERLRSTSMVLDHVDPGASMGPLVRLQSLALDLMLLFLVALALERYSIEEAYWSMANPFAPLQLVAGAFSRTLKQWNKPRNS